MTIIEVVPGNTVVLTWGGIKVLGSGQPTVKFRLAVDGGSMIACVHHSEVPDPGRGMPRFGWRNAGLPRLKAMAEGEAPNDAFLGDITGAREVSPHLARFA